MTQARRDVKDLRKHTRFATSFEAELVQGDETRKVIIGDISAGGAMLHDAQPPATGTDIWLNATGLTIQARVMWQRDGLCGIRFQEEVDPLAVVRDNVPYFRNLRAKRSDPALPASIFHLSPLAD